MNQSADSLIPWIEPLEPFPPISQTWSAQSAAPGLLCAGGDLSVSRLVHAYSQGIFPWFSDDQPILWWSPDPRMLLKLPNFKLHRSMRKVLNRFVQNPECEIRIDNAFEAVISHCANTKRSGQGGSWIVPSMVQAYTELHHAGFAHSVETWINGELVGGLYFVAIGQAVFGESMFHRITDASKIAMAALVAMCRHRRVQFIDCQQNTRHLTSLGASEVSRTWFVQQVSLSRGLSAPEWGFGPVYWLDIGIHSPAQT